MKPLLIFLFVWWLVGALLAFFFYSADGESDWSSGEWKWVSRYSFQEQVAYSLTWYIWFIRAWVRAIIWVLGWTFHWLWDVVMCVWHKWRND